MAISLATTVLLAAAAIMCAPPNTTAAQTQNQTTRAVFTESFIFPNQCTGELMDVTDHTVVTCHDQTRADGTFNEKCEIRQDVSAVGETTGITFQGSGTFKDEFASADACNFTFTNRGRVHLISPGSDVNLILNFDETTVMENCVLTTDTHLVSADCHGGR
jgi:hypothetical protein